MSRYPTRRAVSAGGMVLSDRRNGTYCVLIAHLNSAGALQWTLPKGGQERGESLADTAVREVREETGLEAEVLSELGVIDYWFVWRPEGVRYHKFVHYFVMDHRGGDMQARDDEAEEVVWLPLSEAAARLTHRNERALVLAFIQRDGAGRAGPGRPENGTCAAGAVAG